MKRMLISAASVVFNSENGYHMLSGGADKTVNDQLHLELFVVYYPSTTTYMFA